MRICSSTLSGDRLRRNLGRRILAVEIRLDHLQVPVTVLMPDKLVKHLGILIELIPFHRLPDLADRPAAGGSKSTGA